MAKLRHQTTISTLSVFAVALFCSGSLSADDWLQWRGPERADRSAETGLLQQWDEDGPDQIWVNDHSGLGYAGFSVASDRLYTMGLDEENEFALCLNAETGKEVWRRNVGKRYENNWGDGPRSTPTIDGDRVYFMAARGTLACLQAGDGKVVWSREMSDYGGKIPQWGYSESPLVDGDHVFCTPGGRQGAIIAFNKTSGDVVWQTDELKGMPAHYSSMIAVDHNSTRQLIQLLVNKVVGVDAATGKLLWESDWNGRIAVIPTPIFSDGIVYVTTGYGVGCAGLEIGPDNKVEKLYANRTMKNHHGGVIEVDGHVYGYSDKVGFVCQKLNDGSKIWSDKKIVNKGAVAWADNRFYFVQEKDGMVFLLEATPDGFSEKGKFKLSPQTTKRKPAGKIWVHPVISDGKLYLRDQEYIYCYDVRKKG